MTEKIEFTVILDDLTMERWNSMDLDTHPGWAVCFSTNSDGEIVGDVSCYPSHSIKKIIKSFIKEDQ